MLVGHLPTPPGLKPRQETAVEEGN